MEDHPTGGAVSRPVDKPSQTFSFTPDWSPKTKSTVETPEVPGGSCDCCIKLKKKKSQQHSFSGAWDTCPSHCYESSGGSKSFQNRPEARTCHHSPKLGIISQGPSHRPHPILGGDRMTHIDQAVTWEDYYRKQRTVEPQTTGC